MAKRLVGVVAVLFALATVHVAAQVTHHRYGPSTALVNVLATLRNLSDSSFQQVVWWAANPSDPNITVPDWNNAEHQIMQLKRKDRDAVVSWLNGNGRQALYERGATDKLIGPQRIADNGFVNTSTPSPSSQYRIMPLTAPTLNTASSPSGIQVTGGFALVKKDATRAVVCLSFINRAPNAANAVEFAFPLIDNQGNTVATLTFTRKGTFSPNVAINGPADANGYLNGAFGPRGAYDNCLVSSPGTAALPLAQTRFVSYKVTGVEYANGSSWP
jgi:hypothetical protein